MGNEEEYITPTMWAVFAYDRRTGDRIQITGMHSDRGSTMIDKEEMELAVPDLLLHRIIVDEV